MMSSSISVILPNYNHAHHIGGQLNALLSQSMRPLEILVIDDGSTDDSVNVIGEYARREPLIRFLRNERNIGVLATVNRGWNEARGDYFCGVSADDLVAPCMIERVQKAIDLYPEAGILFGKIRLADANLQEELWTFGASCWSEELYATPGRFLSEFLEVEDSRHSPSCATVYRRSCVEEIGGFPEELGHWSDTFVLRAIGLKYGAVYIPEVLTTFRVTESGFGSSQGRNPHLMLDIVARAVYLMRSPQFRDRFPEDHVARWEKSYRTHVIWDKVEKMRRRILSRDESSLSTLLGWSRSGRRAVELSRRIRARLLSSYHWRRLESYRPDLSCYTKAPG